jgi:hypothetical protein
MCLPTSCSFHTSLSNYCTPMREVCVNVKSLRLGLQAISEHDLWKASPCHVLGNLILGRSVLYDNMQFMAGYPDGKAINSIVL